MYAREQDILLSAQAAIREDLLPELHSPWALRQAETLMWALEHLRQRAVIGGDLLAAEHGELVTLAAQLERVRASSAIAAQALADVATVRLDGRSGVDLPSRMLHDELETFREVAEQIATAVAALDPAPTQELGELRAAVLRYIHCQDARYERLYRVDLPQAR